MVDAAAEMDADVRAIERWAFLMEGSPQEEPTAPRTFARLCVGVRLFVLDRAAGVHTPAIVEKRCVVLKPRCSAHRRSTCRRIA